GKPFGSHRRDSLLNPVANYPCALCATGGSPPLGANPSGGGNRMPVTAAARPLPLAGGSGLVAPARRWSHVGGQVRARHRRRRPAHVVLAGRRLAATAPRPSRARCAPRGAGRHLVRIVVESRPLSLRSATALPRALSLCSRGQVRPRARLH